MLLYYMTTDHWGITALRDKRLKLARISELNDPFELQAIHTPAEAMPSWRKLYDHYDESSGLLCFSDNWRSAVMWAHYADKHFGICLGFDISTEGHLFEMQYHKDFFTVAYDPRDEHFGLTEEIIHKFFSHKFDEWSYEHEWRAFHNIKEIDRLTGLHFADFNENMVLKEVILGARNPHETGDFKKLLESQTNPVRIYKAQPDGTTFKMRELPGSSETFGEQAA